MWRPTVITVYSTASAQAVISHSRFRSRSACTIRQMYKHGVPSTHHQHTINMISRSLDRERCCYGLLLKSDFLHKPLSPQYLLIVCIRASRTDHPEAIRPQRECSRRQDDECQELTALPVRVDDSRPPSTHSMRHSDAQAALCDAGRTVSLFLCRHCSYISAREVVRPRHAAARPRCTVYWIQNTRYLRLSSRPQCGQSAV